MSYYIDLQKQYVFGNFINKNYLESNIDKLPMFFITDDEGVKFLADKYNLNYYVDLVDNWHMIRNKNNYVFEHMFDDGSEPEDNNLVREWCFLAPLFEKLYKEGLNEGLNRCL